jgi:hypothetical protein
LIIGRRLGRTEDRSEEVCLGILERNRTEDEKRRTEERKQESIRYKNSNI